MTVSVIIPVFNEERNLTKCLLTINAQTKRPMEIIVVDDGSTDRSCEVVSRFASKKTILVKQDHLGVAVARNSGAARAKGGILVFVDADMYFDTTYLKHLIAPIEKGLCKATFTYDERVGNLNNKWARLWDEEVGGRQLVEMGESANNFRAIERILFTKLGGYKDVGYGEDVTVLQRANVKARGTMAKCWHTNPDSLSEVFFSARWMGRGEIIRNRLMAVVVFSFVNSVRKCAERMSMDYWIFKCIFDFGIWIGVWQRWVKKVRVK